MSGLDIQAEIAAALVEAGEAVGTGAYTCTIRRASTEADEPKTPWDPPADPANEPTEYPVTAIEDVQDVRDISGMLVGIQKRTLTINATGVAPLKSDVIAVGVAPDDVTNATVFEEIIAVKPLSPGGVVLLYELELAI